MAIVQPIHWKRIGRDLLPMRDHIAEITELIGREKLSGAKSKRG